MSRVRAPARELIFYYHDTQYFVSHKVPWFLDQTKQPDKFFIFISQVQVIIGFNLEELAGGMILIFISQLCYLVLLNNLIWTQWPYNYYIFIHRFKPNNPFSNHSFNLKGELLKKKVYYHLFLDFTKLSNKLWSILLIRKVSRLIELSG